MISDFIKANYLSKTDLEISKIYEIKERDVRKIRNDLGLRKKPAPHKYTKEQMQFLAEYRPKNDIRSLAVLFNNKFKTNISGEKLGRVCRGNGFYCDLSLSVLNTTTKIGDEKASGGRGRFLIKISETEKVFKHRFLYEKYHNVVLSTDDIIVFLDGDKTNYNKENLYRVSRKVNFMMCNNRWYFNNAKLTLTAIKWCELFYAMKNNY